MDLDDKFHDECAVIGVFNHSDAAKFCYLGLYSLQHRGQEGTGIASTDGVMMHLHREMGLVSDVYSSEVLESLKGNSAIGHNRYATCGSKNWQNLQPFMANFSARSYAIAHNGNLVNASELRHQLEKTGAIFSASSDTEVILHLIARAVEDDQIIEKIRTALSVVKGAYSMVVLTHNSLIAARDSSGVRPLSLAKMGDSYVVASETCAFDLIGAEFIRDIAPGEILEITAGGKLNSIFCKGSPTPAFCVFEYIYFARPDSTIEGRNVYLIRKKLGAELAKEHPVEADLVIPVPDSGVPAALGFAEEIGLPMEFGLIRNHYVGRTFIEPQQSIRDFGVKVKLNANKGVLDGKRVIVVDDSIVRGTTCQKIVIMLRNAGAKEVHFRISSPPVIRPCYYGIDTPSKGELTAANNSIENIKDYIGADSLGYLSVEGMYRALGSKQCNFCDACFTDNYRLGVSPADNGHSCSCQNYPGSYAKKINGTIDI